MRVVILNGAAADDTPGARIERALLAHLAAQDHMGKPLLPPWAYRLVGTLGWRRAARRWGAQKDLKRRPYRVEV